jgi:hypothetical protein
LLWWVADKERRIDAENPGIFGRRTATQSTIIVDNHVAL